MFTAQELKSLNELEMLVYQYVTEHRSAVPYMRIRELATEAHVSTTTVLHFCKKMGCEGFSQFKWKLKEENGIDTQDKDIPDALNELQTFFWRVGTPGLHPAGCHQQRELHPGPGVRPDPALLHGRSPQRRGKLRFDVADPRRLPAGIPGPPGA